MKPADIRQVRQLAERVALDQETAEQLLAINPISGAATALKIIRCAMANLSRLQLLLERAAQGIGREPEQLARMDAPADGSADGDGTPQGTDARSAEGHLPAQHDGTEPPLVLRGPGGCLADETADAEPPLVLRGPGGCFFDAPESFDLLD